MYILRKEEYVIPQIHNFEIFREKTKWQNVFKMHRYYTNYWKIDFFAMIMQCYVLNCFVSKYEEFNEFKYVS